MLSDKELKKYRSRIKTQGTEDDHKAEIGTKLQKAREKTHLSQDDVAEILGLSGRTIGRYERGEVMCSLEQLNVFCQLYECKLVDLLPKDMLPNVSELETFDPVMLNKMSQLFENALSRTA